MSFINSVNTKLEAYLLINDPTKLLSMLYSKYGDIDEDRDLYYINQIIYNRKTLLNCLFKEYQLIYNHHDFFKRYYHYFECIKRIPKLSEYYKNYYLFFCKPFLKDFKMTKLIQINGNHKAEIFYKKNYESLTKNENNESDKIKENSIYSFDNITNNKTIFDEKIKNIIENSSSKITLSLEGSEINKGNYNLLTKRSNDDSFLISINNLFNNKKENKFNNHLINNNLYFPQKHKFYYKNKIKSSIYNLSKNSYRSNHNVEKNNKNKKSLSPSFYHNKKRNIDGFNKLNNNINNNLKLNKPRNKTSNNSKNLNTNLSNFEKLSATINNNHNSINNSKTMRISLNNNNNKMYQEKLNSRQILIPNTHSINSNSKNKKRKNSNITFEKNSSNQNNKIEKLNSNSNFLNFNNNNNNLTIKSQKRNIGSKFNLVKNTLNSIQVNTNKNNINSNKVSNFSLTKNQIYYKNHSKTNNNSNVSLSLNKSKKKDKSITQEKNNKNDLNKKRNKSNIDSGAFSNRKNLKYSINNKIFYPSNNNISNFRIYMKLNNINISSRNKKETITKQNQTNIKSLRKDIKINSNSIDEDKMIINNIISNLENKKVLSYEKNKNIINQLDELIKKPKYSNHYRFNINTMSSPNLNNEKPNNKRFNDGLNNLNYIANNLTIKKFKPININLNKNKNDKNEKNKKIVLSKK